MDQLPDLFSTEDWLQRLPQLDQMMEALPEVQMQVVAERVSGWVGRMTELESSY